MDSGGERAAGLALSLFVRPEPGRVDVTIADGVNTMESGRRRGGGRRGEKFAGDLFRLGVAGFIEAQPENRH